MHYPCPLCGRAVGRHGRPFTDPSQTASHITGAHDAQHSGKRGDEYREEIEEAAVEEGELDFDADDSGDDSGPATVRNPATGQVEPLHEVLDELYDASMAVGGETHQLADENGARIGALEELVAKQSERIDALEQRVEDLYEGVELLKKGRSDWRFDYRDGVTGAMEDG